MAKKATSSKTPKSRPQAKAQNAGRDLSSAVTALHEAAQSLADTAAQMAKMMQQMVAQRDGAGNTQGPVAAPSPGQLPAATKATGAKDGSLKTNPSDADREAKRFHERLEQTGQLVDVDATTDLSALPPRVTHIRRPDGSIERIGFSAFPSTQA